MGEPSRGNARWLRRTTTLARVDAKSGHASLPRLAVRVRQALDADSAPLVDAKVARRAVRVDFAQERLAIAVERKQVSDALVFHAATLSGAVKVLEALTKIHTSVVEAHVLFAAVRILDAIDRGVAGQQSLPRAVQVERSRTPTRDDTEGD